MPPRRKRAREASPVEQEQPEQQEHVEPQQGDAVQPPDNEAPRPDRRGAMADVARRRAAHFAHFQVDDDDDQDNVHVGTNQARALGPWSSALELVNARDRAAAEREEKIRSSKEHAQDTINWQPSRDPSLGPHSSNAVPPLFDICLKLLVQYIDCVESLWGVPDVIKVKLAAAVCQQRKMAPQAAALFAASAPTELLLPDCHQLDTPAMVEVLRQCASHRLERLELGSCGRGFGSEAAALLAAQGRCAGLRCLRLAGAYRLEDAALLQLLRAAPRLQQLGLQTASRLSGQVVVELPQLLPQLRALDLSECRGIDAASLAAALPQLVALRSLCLDGIPEVDDGLVAVAARGPALRELSLRQCQAVGDGALAALAAQRPELEALAVDECSKVTDAGLLALAASCKALRSFSARHCVRLSDGALAALAQRGQLRELDVSGSPAAGPELLRALALCCRDCLEALDLSFCRQVPEAGVGLVADSCSRLRRLALFGCSQVGSKALCGHSNEGLVEVLGAY